MKDNFMLKHEPFLFILSSPSGAGKTTIAKAILAEDKNIETSISYTTRSRRNNEIDGQDYYFVTQEKFEELRNSDQFLEFALIYDKFYGTPKFKVEELLEQNKDVLFDIDWQGTKQIKTVMPERTVSVFILPPSLKELEFRLRSRGTESEESIKNRLAQAKKEITYWPNYDYVIVNNELERSVYLIKAILEVERLKRTNIADIADKLL